MNYGKAVRYTENGKEFDALVVHEHGLYPEAQGSNGQPLAHIVIADPAKEALNLADMHGKMILRLDVAHASHQHSDAWIASHPEQQKEWSGGRWSEMGTSPMAIWEATRQAAKQKEDSKAVAAAESAKTQSEHASLDAQIAAAENEVALQEKRKKLAELQAKTSTTSTPETVQ